MALIRRELHEDVKGVVANAEAVTDWRRMLTAYPWATLGAAFIVGYLIVPRRHTAPATKADLSAVRESVDTTREKVVEAAREAGQEAKTHKKGLLGAAVAMVAPLAWRAAQGYALQYLEHWLLQQQERHVSPDGPARSSPAGGPGRPQPPGTRREVEPGSY
jgi:hypothetical protein